MTRHRKDRGLRTERVVAQYLQEWWPFATVGRGAGKDVLNVPFDIEVKARASFQPLEWLRQVSKRVETSGEFPSVVMRCNGQGEAAETYIAILRFGDLVQLLIKAGYTDFQTDTDKLEPVYCQCGNTIMKGSPCHICEKLDNANL
jgi:hypothetical protein